MSRIRTLHQRFHRPHVQHNVSGAQGGPLLHGFFRQLNRLGAHLRQICGKRPAVRSVPHLVDGCREIIMDPGHLNLSGFHRPHDAGQKGKLDAVGKFHMVKSQGEDFINHLFPVLMAVGVPACRKYQHRQRSTVMN